MKKKMFSARQMIAAVLIGSLIVSPPPLVYSAVEDNICSLASVLAPFFGVGNETNVPSSEEFSHSSLVEKINYLESENQALQNKLLVLEGNQSSLLSKADYLQTTSDQIGSGVSSIQSLVQGINIPDYSANFTTLAAGMAGINTSLGTVNSNTSGLAQEIASLQTKLDSVIDAVQESTAAASSLYNLYVYVPKSTTNFNYTGHEVSLTSPSGLQTVTSKLKDTGDYWSTKLYFDFKGDCKIKYKIPFDITTNSDFEDNIYISGTGQVYQLIVGEAASFDSLTWEQVHNVVQAGGGYTWFSVGDTRTIDLSSIGAGEATVTLVDIAPDGKRITCMITAYTGTAPQRQMNSGRTNTGSWRDSTLRVWLNGAGYFNNLPADLRAVIAKTNVITGDSDGTTLGGENITTEDYLFLPAAKEIFGGAYYGTEKETLALEQFQYFATIATSSSSRSLANWWWLRSPLYWSNENFLFLVNGTSGYANAGGSYSVFPAFTIQ